MGQGGSAKIFEQVKNSGAADVTETKKRSPQSPGRLYDLTTLQKEANRLHHFPASRTLQLAQALYERHKAITYPRTDSKALPEDYGPPARNSRNISGELSPHAQLVLQSNWVDENNKHIQQQANQRPLRHYSNEYPPGGLDANELKIYNLILKRFISAFYPPAQWDVTVVRAH